MYPHTTTNETDAAQYQSQDTRYKIAYHVVRATGTEHRRHFTFRCQPSPTHYSTPLNYTTSKRRTPSTLEKYNIPVPTSGLLEIVRRAVLKSGWWKNHCHRQPCRERSKSTVEYIHPWRKRLVWCRLLGRNKCNYAQKKTASQVDHK